MTVEVRRVIAGDHPALAGHFPGNPIVPGVVILDEVVRVAVSRDAGMRLAVIDSVRFNAPLRPDEAFDIRLTATGDARLDFVCSRGGERIASGRLVMEPISP